MNRYDESFGTPFKYEYQCIDQQDNVVSEGEFVIRLTCTIRSPRVRTTGILAIFDDDRETLDSYRGYNHLKKINMKVTNMITKSVRCFD